MLDDGGRILMAILLDILIFILLLLLDYDKTVLMDKEELQRFELIEAKLNILIKYQQQRRGKK